MTDDMMIDTGMTVLIACLGMLAAFAVLRRLDATAEKALLARIVNGDQQALSDLYDQYAALLYSVVIAVVKKQEEAEDLLQEIFLLIWKKSATFDTSRDNVYAWLTTLARNRAIDRTRSKAFRSAQKEVAEPIPEITPSAMDNPLDAAIMQERAGQVQAAMQQIPAEQREVILLAYFEGYSQSQMAEHLGLPLGTVKTRVRQGMKKLSELLAGRV